MNRQFTILLTFLTSVLCHLQATASVQDTCPVVPLQVEQLPDLNIPRSGHHTFFAGGQTVVMGGHTTGFVPTPTAEYYADGQWHEVPMPYSHDQGAALQLQSGLIVIAGGHEQPLGIGQTFTLEQYNPETHRFSGYGCLEQKRCFAQCLEMEGERVVITGNWYQNDSMELWEGAHQDSPLRNVAQQRSAPYLLRTARSNAIAFSACDIHGEPFDSIVIDRLVGTPFTEPLFREWKPFYSLRQPHWADSFIGDELTERYSYLLTVQNSDSQLAFVRVDGEQFRLLPTACPVPMVCQGDSIRYFSCVVADRKAQRAYVMGKDEKSRLYVLAVDYNTAPAPLTLYRSDVLPAFGMTSPVLTGDGNLMLAGGFVADNFTPTAVALIARLSDAPRAAAGASWLWWLSVGLVALLVAATLAYIILYKRRCGKCRQESGNGGSYNGELLEQINQLMEREQLFLVSDLKVTDIAERLGLHRNTVSDCINNQVGSTFSQFVNKYRVSYAQQLMRKHPDMKRAAICTAAGFANETSFYRTFKTVTGMTPKEWMEQETRNNTP